MCVVCGKRVEKKRRTREARRARCRFLLSLLVLLSGRAALFRARLVSHAVLRCIPPISPQQSVRHPLILLPRQWRQWRRCDPPGPCAEACASRDRPPPPPSGIVHKNTCQSVMWPPGARGWGWGRRGERARRGDAAAAASFEGEHHEICISRPRPVCARPVVSSCWSRWSRWSCTACRRASSCRQGPLAAPRVGAPRATLNATPFPGIESIPLKGSPLKGLWPRHRAAPRRTLPGRGVAGRGDGYFASQPR